MRISDWSSDVCSSDLAQSWTAHHRLPLHRAVGLSGLLLFRFLIDGLAAIIDVTAKGYITADHPVRVMFGGPFLIGLALAVADYVTVYYRALKFTRTAGIASGSLHLTPRNLFDSRTDDR